jgi:hypothetical protein
VTRDPTQNHGDNLKKNRFKKKIFRIPDETDF